jgi:uncharacterized protein with von Willebrand factor type A (vWA) domain
MNQPAAPPSLLFERLEAPLAPLERLPRALWLWSLVHSQGSVVPRLGGIEALRDALLAGTLPAPDDWRWPAPALAAEVGAALRELELPRYCRQHPDLTDTVLRSLLWHLDQIVDHIDRGATEDRAVALVIERFREDWKERCGELDELVAVFGDLGDLGKNMRWDLLHGLLRSSGWQQVARIRRLIEGLPELARLIRRLGRAREATLPEEAQSTDVQVMEQIIAPRTQVRTTRVPDLPGETRGVRRSSRVARMLAAEAMLLNHPRLRLVWHARHAERTLLTYEDDDRLPEVVHGQGLVWRPSPNRVPERRMEMGPMLVCVDTSGSMQGGAEAVAKAAVLEAVRTAHVQRRPCHVFAFSGPDEVVEMELGVDPDGLERLTHFMGQTFRGGTDISGPLERVLAKLEDESWALADLLIASDGEFGAPRSVVEALAGAKDRLGLRVQGILIGDRETIGFHEIADDMFWVRDWRRYGTSDSDSPVPTSGLTAAYFPGALRTRESEATTVTGDEASQAVRAGRHAGER